jgi:hypothetical protein
MRVMETSLDCSSSTSNVALNSRPATNVCTARVLRPLDLIDSRTYVRVRSERCDDDPTYYRSPGHSANPPESHQRGVVRQRLADHGRHAVRRLRVAAGPGLRLQNGVLVQHERAQLRVEHQHGEDCAGAGGVRTGVGEVEVLQRRALVQALCHAVTGREWLLGVHRCVYEAGRCIHIPIEKPVVRSASNKSLLGVRTGVSALARLTAPRAPR